MRRDDICLYVSPANRSRLEAIIADRNSSSKAVWRSRIVLATGDGLGTNAIMKRTGKSKPCVWRWQERYIEEGVDGLLRDKTRPPGTKPLSAAMKRKVLAKTGSEMPPNATHWSVRSMATAVGISHSSVQRIWAEAGLKPHLVRRFKISNDPQFEEKVTDVVGLYMNPPDRALVLCVDEKSQIQALDRTQPGFKLHFTPTSASWLNLVERFFAEITSKRIRRGVFRSVAELKQAVHDYLDRHNADPKPFVWTKTAEVILEKERRALDKLEAIKAEYQASESEH
jgi:transposase